MKLFQGLLVAPAALGLIAPIAVNADTAFTSTTTLGGSAYFTTVLFPLEQVMQTKNFICNTHMD